MQDDEGATAADRGAVTRFDAATLAALGALSSIVALLGWFLGLPRLAGFGLIAFPIWPLTAIGFLALSLGHLAEIYGRRATAAVLLAIPVAVALASAFQTMSGTDAGIDRLLFGDAVSGFNAAYPGRSGVNPIVSFLLLGAAGYLSILRPILSDELKGLALTLALGAAAASAFFALTTFPAMTILAYAADDPAARYRSVSVPATIGALCVSGAIFVRHAGNDWVRLFAVRTGRWRLVRLLLPAALVVPLLPPLLSLFEQRHQSHSILAYQLLLLLGNLLLVALVGYWVAMRIARDQAALSELSHALDNATVVVTTPDGTISHWSQGCELLYGWPADEARGQNKYALLRSRCQSSDHRLPVPAAQDTHELVEVTRDGRELRILERVHRVQSPSRGALLVLGINDISERVEAIAALHASEERLALAISAHELGIFEWHVETGRIDWSPGTESRLGLETGTLSSFEGWRSVVEDSDVQDLLETISSTVKARADKFSFRWRLVPPLRVRAVEGSARAFYTREGNLERVVGVILDVTEREEREAALRRREVHLQSVIETVPDAIVVINDEGSILQFSSAAEALWGYSAEEVVGRPFTILVPTAERGGSEAVFRRFLETGRGLADRVVTGIAQTKEGRSFPIEARTGVARADDETLITVFVRDLTDQAAAEARLSELNAEIAHVSRQSAMSELAADMAHELNQPLSATANFLAAARMLLERDEDRARILDLLRMGSEQTQRAGEIIRRLRTFMAKGEVEMRAELVETTVRDAVDLVVVGASQVNIRVNFRLDPEVRFIFADRIQVQQVLVNLLRNAMDALRQSGQSDKVITISSRRAQDQMVEIEVADNGPGMPVQVLEHLFSRFTTTKGPGGGMGIGLSISKRIIEAHGGTLRGENRPEGGACFRFTLPAVEQGGNE
ncbi:MAG: PAS domain S-box protein [Sphingomonas sp.]|uniref:PAS domain S-box protein n=1 Tax=Sphingomonas sp. TaxID=28214 RepID=UPI001B022C82|nr:PAS domain S-box protein [Sphingomonas sp.]MBO9623697.1 PAS domain S-box protein [Sphingomonas sp.]